MVWVEKRALPYPPSVAIADDESTHTVNLTHNSDLVYDQMVDNAGASLDPTEQKALVKETDKYAMEHQWTVVTLGRITYNIFHPWFKSYGGEQIGQGGSLKVFVGFFSWCWIDRPLKEAMGH
jgi:ABC-type transport system substrate-binding protein